MVGLGFCRWAHPFRGKRVRGPDQTLNRKFITSPSCTMYSLAFGAHLAGFLGALFALVGDVVLVGDGLRADEAAFEVGVDHAGGLGRGGADRHGPGAHFLRLR